jgi:hypothetical protein
MNRSVIDKHIYGLREDMNTHTFIILLSPPLIEKKIYNNNSSID